MKILIGNGYNMYKNIIVVIAILSIAACAKDGTNGLSGPSGATGATGAAGGNGTNGSNGTNGHSIVTTQTTATTCVFGGWTLFTAIDTNDNGVLDVVGDSNLQSMTICNGLNGAMGIPGTQGIPGLPGATGPQGNTGATGSQGAQGNTGATGAQGPAGTPAPATPFTPVALVNPCGDNPSIRDEVFLRLSNGMLLASFSDNASGLNTRFILLTTGTYQTTDNDNCVFSVDVNGNIYNENHTF